MLPTRSSLVLTALLACSTFATAQESGVPRPVAAARADEFLASGEATRAVGGRDQAMAALVDFEQAAAWAAQGRASETYARARLGKALALVDLGRPGEALSALEEAVATARASGLRELLVDLLDRESELAEQMGLVDQAVRAAREGALVRDELGQVEEAIAGLLRLAELELSRDGGRAAAPALQAALERARRAGLSSATQAALEGQIELSLAAGDVDTARRAAEELVGIRSESGDGSGGGSSLVLLGRTLAAGGEGAAAIPILQDAAIACAEVGDQACESDAREVLAATLLELERPREAVQEILGLVAARRSQGDRAGELRAHLGLSLAFRQLGGLESALASLAEAERLAEVAAPATTRAALRVERARLLRAARQVLPAADAWEEALELLALPDEDLSEAEAPTQLLELPHRELLLREQLDFLVEAGLWARALTACAGCTQDGTEEALSLEDLRELTLGQDATFLTWRALDDSLLGFALTPDGRLLGARVEGLGGRDLEGLAAQVEDVAPRVEVPKPGEDPSFAGDDLRLALRRLHDALFGPLEPALPAEGEALLIQAPPQLRGLPWGLLLESEGVFLGQRFGLAELSSPSAVTRGPGSGRLRVVADLREPDHPGMDVRRLVARLDGDVRRREEAASALAAEERADRSRGRTRNAPGRRRSADLAPSPAEPLPLAGERRYDGDLVILAGASWVPERLTSLAPEAAVLILHADCAELAPPPLDGALVALPSCDGLEAETAARALFDAGARAVLVLRWDPGAAAREALGAGWTASIDAGTTPAEALRAAAGAGLPSSAWGSLRLLGAAK